MLYRGPSRTGRTEIAQALATPNGFLVAGIGLLNSQSGNIRPMPV
jgi:hypothetical protein